jgi:nitroreductase
VVGALPGGAKPDVAARSLGLGTTFTTFQMFIECELRELLGIPKEIKFGMMIPIGWPQNDFVKVKRKPISKVIHWDKWSDSPESA